MINYHYNRCPYSTKKDLVEWAATYFKKPKSRYIKLKKEQLNAIWYNMRIKK